MKLDFFILYKRNGEVYATFNSFQEKTYSTSNTSGILKPRGCYGCLDVQLRGSGLSPAKEKKNCQVKENKFIKQTILITQYKTTSQNQVYMKVHASKDACSDRTHTRTFAHDDSEKQQVFTLMVIELQAEYCKTDGNGKHQSRRRPLQ